MFILSRHRPSPPDERFVFTCFHASSDDDNRSPFQLSLVHAIVLEIFPALNDNEHDNETISISWQNVLRWWMAQMWKDSWDDSLPFIIITCLLRPFGCYAYSLPAPLCFSRIISGTQIVKLHLQVWDWWQPSTWPVSILYFLMISLTWPGCTRGRFGGQLVPVRELRFDDLCARWGKPRHWTMSMVWLSYADAGQWKAWSMLWELIRTSSNKLHSKLVSELEKGRCNCDLQSQWQVSYHTIHFQRCKRKRKEVNDAADAEVEV